MTSVRSALVLALFAVAHVNGCSNVQVNVQYDDNGGAPTAMCYDTCSDDEPLKEPTFFSGNSYKRFPELTERYKMMVTILYKDGVFAGCELGPYKSDKEISCEDSGEACSTEEEFVCPEGFTKIGDQYYHVSPKKTSHKYGIKYCAGINAVPAIIESQEQMDLIAGFLTVSVYLGINDIETEDVFKNPGRGIASYTNFNGGEPNNIGNEDCVVAKDNREYRWNDVRCWKRFNTLCQLNLPEVQAEESGSYCGLGDKYDDSTCFCATDSDNTGTYDEAVQFCQLNGMELATINSEAEQSFAAGLLDSDAWIGLNDKDIEGSFTWVNGAPLEFISWYSNEPSTYEGNLDDCVEMVKSQGYKWSAIGCKKARQYLCRGPTISA